MARPKEFDETEVLDAAVDCFWLYGFRAVTVRELADSMGIASASLYNTFGDKRALFRRALRRYTETTYEAPIAALERASPPVEAMRLFFREIVELSLADEQRKGCFLINASLEIAPEEVELHGYISETLLKVQDFFRRSLSAGIRTGNIKSSQSVEDLSRLLLGVWVGIRVVGRTQPNRALLEGLLRPTFSILDSSDL
jgi:TetR/AcrR family transcriptional repressor of nem operon